MAPKRYTELFFLDELTALSAGHRPCFECRHADAMQFAQLWSTGHGLPRRAYAVEMDRQLHDERLLPEGRKRIYRARLADLPQGTMIYRDGAFWATAAGGQLLRWSPQGYDAMVHAALDLRVDVLTPPGIVAVLQAGYRPARHPTWLALT